MNRWLSPTSNTLEEVISTSSGRLLLCSPYISRPGLNIVADALPSEVSRIEIWTKLDPHDWLTGASDYEGLLDFVQQTQPQVDNISLRESSTLHAKIIVSDGPRGLAGSANLTGGGFGGNLEVARLVSDTELDELRDFAESMRSSLSPVNFQQFDDFVAQCVAKIDSREALLDLIRKEMLPVNVTPQILVSYGDFLNYIESHASPVADEVLRIAKNLDRNNNTGKVRQAFFGVQRFLQEYPNHRDHIASLPDDEWFDISTDPYIRGLASFSTGLCR